MLKRSSKKNSSNQNTFLVVGLGNPGKEYVGTRHNVGAAVVEALAEAHNCVLRKSRDHSLTAEISLEGKKILLAFPQTFMNNSGQAVSSIMRRNGISNPENLIVVHDEMDTPPGDLRIKFGGGLAGHNGLKSITNHLHTQDYLRLRLGIGKPADKDSGANYVLKRPSKAEQEIFSQAIQKAIEAIEALILEGKDAAMARFNNRS
ncbi:MAG: Peptidyl-tRNA hydrolase [Acidimicrobiales bacterium AG-410-I20]|nr:MAG: Peptidyl-tRNA hydrolase [Acidimicrobiales bacterium AG-410-I20]